MPSGANAALGASTASNAPFAHVAPAGEGATCAELALVHRATSPRMDLVAIVDLRPLPVTTAPARRIPQLLGGLVLYGTSMAMQLRATLGLDPWDVFHQGLARHLPLSFGLVTAVTGAAVLLLWIPLRQRPGIGTVANVIVIAVSVELAVLAVGWLLGGTVGVGTVAYALAIGPLTQAFLPWFVIATPRGPRASTDGRR